MNNKKISLPRTPAAWLEAVMNFIFFLCGILAVGCVLLISVYMVLSGVPAIQKIGLFRFLFGTRWASTAADPAYGILPFILSSVYGTLGATVIGVPIGLLTAVFLSKAAGPKVRTVVVTAIELLSGIPSVVFGLLGMQVLVRGIPHISWKFLTTTASVLKGTDGILPAILNTLYVILLTLLIVLPLGVGAAVYLTEYAQNRKVISVIEFTNETLAGIPSIIYGLVGMLVFAQTLGFQTCLLSGSLTLVIMNLPTIIRTTQESLKTVPQGYREGALGLGAGKWHIIRTIVLPCSIDGIVTGCILAVGRIVGESAALLFTAGAAEVIANGVLKAYTSNGATLSVLLYLRAFEDGDFDSAWAIGAVLLVLVLAINLAARLAKTKLKQKQ